MEPSIHEKALHYYNEYFVKRRIREEKEKSMYFSMLLSHTQGKKIKLKTENIKNLENSIEISH